MTLQELYARLDKATGPARELDFAMLTTLGWKNRGPGGRFLHCPFDDCRVIQREDGVWIEEKHAPTLTASIDAALGLVERLLPGVKWYVNNELGGDIKGAECFLVPCNAGGYETEFAPTAPLAILKSLVAALIEKEKS